ncbi:hypothetical protein FOZ62_003512, partial [Perkinsus olseni]
MSKERESRSQMITLQFGRASNHVGAQYWNILEKSGDKKAVEPQYRSIGRPRVIVCDFNRALGPAMSRQGNPELGSDESSRVYDEQASRVQVYRRDDVDGGGDMYWTNYMSTPLENCCNRKGVLVTTIDRAVPHLFGSVRSAFGSARLLSTVKGNSATLWDLILVKIGIIISMLKDTHFIPGDYGTKEDAYYYSPHTDWSETSLRRLLEGCDRLGTVQ